MLSDQRSIGHGRSLIHYNRPRFLCMEYSPSVLSHGGMRHSWPILRMSSKSCGLCFCVSTQVGAAATNQSVAAVLKQMQESDADGDDSWPADVASNVRGAQLIPTPVFRQKSAQKMSIDQ